MKRLKEPVLKHVYTGRIASIIAAVRITINSNRKNSSRKTFLPAVMH